MWTDRPASGPAGPRSSPVERAAAAPDGRPGRPAPRRLRSRRIPPRARSTRSRCSPSDHRMRNRPSPSVRPSYRTVTGMWSSANPQAGMTRTVRSAIGGPPAPRTITSTSPVGAHSDFQVHHPAALAPGRLDLPHDRLGGRLTEPQHLLGFRHPDGWRPRVDRLPGPPARLLDLHPARRARLAILDRREGEAGRDGAAEPAAGIGDEVVSGASRSKKWRVTRAASRSLPAMNALPRIASGGSSAIAAGANVRDQQQGRRDAHEEPLSPWTSN